MSRTSQKRLTFVWFAALVLSAALFQLWPGIDLAASRLFFTPGKGFTLARSAALDALRQTIWWLSNLMVLFAAVAVAAALARRPFLDLRRGVFILALYLLGPALLVDGILKRFWGRARPANIDAFGGTQHFTPPLIPSDQCADNCSFVSGEGAAATALALSLAVLAPAVRSRVPPAAFRLYVAFAVIVPVAGLALRVMLGRHFLSDTVFAVLFVSGIGLILSRLLLDRPTA